MSVRIGIGYDVHAFTEGDHVTLGGVRIAHDKALLAHSDGDVLIHAVCDALLGALALGDIGRHFPPGDAQWKGADSRLMLRAVQALLQERGWRVHNVDAVVVCERPKLAPHVEIMRSVLAEDMRVEPGAVSVKATTSERLGFTGREEGIAAQAVASVVPR